MRPKRRRRVRTPRTVVARRTGTVVIDSRTRRERTRTESERAAIRRETDEIF